MQEVNYNIGDVVGVFEITESAMRKLSGSMTILADRFKAFYKCIKPFERAFAKRKPFSNSKHKPRQVRMRGK
jgi:hypothetical protein